MAVEDTVRIRFEANTAAFNAGLKSATGSLSRFGTNAFFLGSRITAGVGVPIALLTKAVVGIGAAFDQAMTESLAIMGRDGNRMRTQMEDVAKSIALTTKFSAEEAAQAYFFLASSGLNAAESMRALPVAAQFAQAGVIDLEKATELLSDAYITLGLRSSDPIQNMQNMQRVADVLTEANNRAQGSIIEFAQALTNRAGVAFRVFGISVEEGVAALAAFAERGIKGRTAGRQLFIVIRDLQRAFLKNREEWEKLVGPGAVFDQTTGEFKNLSVIIGRLEDNLEGLSDETKKTKLDLLGFQERSLQATLALIGASDRMAEFAGWMHEAGGATQRVSEKQMRSFTNQLGLVSERLKQVGIDLFDAFKSTIEQHVLPMARSLIQRLKNLTAWINTLSKSNKIMIVNILALTVALGPLVAAFGALSLAVIPVIGAFHLLKPLLVLIKMGAIGSIPPLINMAKGFGIVAASARGLAVVLTFLTGGWFAVIKAIGAVLVAAGALFVAWKALTFGTKKSTTSLINLADQIGITHDRLVELIAEYKKLSSQSKLTDDEANQLAHTQEMLAAASGMTTAQFVLEAESSDRLINRMEEQTAVAQKMGAVKIKEINETIAALEKELELRELQAGLVEEALSQGTGGMHSMMAVRGREGDSTVPSMGNYQAWDELNTLSLELLETRQNLMEQLVALRNEQERIATSTGNLTEEKKRQNAETANEINLAAEAAARDQIAALAKKEHTDKVHDLADSLMGLADDSMTVLVEAWKELTDMGNDDAAAVARLWPLYEKLREGVEDLPPSLEKATRGFIEEAKALEFAESAIGKFIKSMEGFDPIAEELLEDQDLIVKKFNELEGAVDPRFFEEHGRMLETLAEHYGDDLLPGLKKIIDKYWEWKGTSKKVVDAVVKDTSKAREAIIDAGNSMTANMKDKQAELAVFSLDAQEAELFGLKKGYNAMVLAHAEKQQQMVDNLNILAEPEKAAAMDRIDLFRKNSEDMLKAEKRIGLLRMMVALGVDEDIIRNHKEKTDEWLQDTIDVHAQMMESWTGYQQRVETLTSLAGLFTELSNISPQLEGVAQALGTVASATGAWGTSIQNFKTAETGFDKLTASIDMATAALAAFFAISQIGSRAGRTAAGAMTGAQMGAGLGLAIAGPAGQAIGAAIGGLVGGIAGLLMKDPGWKKIESTIKNQWDISVSQALSKEIAITAKKIGSDLGASLLHINQVIEESGGVTAGNVGKWTRHVRDAFSMIHQGIFTASQAAEVLDENFASLVKAGTQLGGVLRADVFELIRLDEQFRTNSQAIKEFKEAMVDQAIEGLMLFTEGVTFTRQKFEEAFDAKIAKVTELGKKTEEEINQMRVNFDEKLFRKLKGDFNELSAMVEMAFATMVMQGKSLVEILLTLGPALDELTVLVEALGYTGSETIEMLMRLREFTKVNEGLMKKIAGTQMMLVGLTNSGYMSEKMFKQFGRTVTRQFNQLIARGLSADEALMIMMPSLIALEEGARLYGFEISKNTQKIIDQAKKKGLMGDKAKTVDDHMLEAQHAMVDALGALIILFGGELPDSLKKLQEESKETAGKIDDEFQAAVKDIQSAFDSLEIPDRDHQIDVDMNFHASLQGVDLSGLTGISIEGISGHKDGGIINKPTLTMTGEGGQPELIGPVGFMSKALEGALSQTGQGKQQEEILNEMRGLRKDMRLMPIHLRDAIILAN